MVASPNPNTTFGLVVYPNTTLLRQVTSDCSCYALFSGLIVNPPTQMNIMPTSQSATFMQSTLMPTTQLTFTSGATASTQLQWLDVDNYVDTLMHNGPSTQKNSMVNVVVVPT